MFLYHFKLTLPTIGKSVFKLFDITQTQIDPI